MRQIKDFIPEVKNYYFVSSDGDIISKARKTPITLRPSKKRNGYLQVSLTREDGTIMYASIHRLVAICFLEAGEKDDNVNHKDGNKENNKVYNLEWISQKKNISHAWETGLSSPRVGETNNFSSITNKEAQKIVDLLREGFSDKEIHNETGISIRGVISRIRRRETWRHLTEDGEKLGKSQKRK